MVDSKPGILVKGDWKRWVRNQKLFISPLLVLYLGFVIARVSKTGFSFDDFVPTNAEVTALALFVLNALLDLAKKWGSTKRYRS